MVWGKAPSIVRVITPNIPSCIIIVPHAEPGAIWVVPPRALLPAYAYLLLQAAWHVKQTLPTSSSVFALAIVGWNPLLEQSCETCSHAAAVPAVHYVTNPVVVVPAGVEAVIAATAAAPAPTPVAAVPAAEAVAYDLTLAVWMTTLQVRM